MREMLRASWFSIFLLLASSLDDAFAGQQKVVPTVAPSQNSSPSSITTSLMPSSKTTTSSRPSVNRFSSQKPTAFANPAPISEPLSSQPSQNPKVPGSMTPTIAPTNIVMTSVPVDLTLTTSPLSVPIISPFASSMPTISSSSPSPVPFGVASINPTLSYQPSSLEPSTATPVALVISTNPSLSIPFPPTENPSAYPSNLPSDEPFLVPSSMPGIATSNTAMSKLKLVIQGLSKLSGEDIPLWENITSYQVFMYWNNFSTDLIYISSVTTELTNQIESRRLQNGTGATKTAYIYNQTITYKVKSTNASLEERIFLAPFETDTNSYTLKLEQLSVSNPANPISVVSVESLNQPSVAPAPSNNDGGTDSTLYIIIAASVVGGLIVISGIGYLTYRRSEKAQSPISGESSAPPQDNQIHDDESSTPDAPISSIRDVRSTGYSVGEESDIDPYSVLGGSEVGSEGVPVMGSSSQTITLTAAGAAAAGFTTIDYTPSRDDYRDSLLGNISDEPVHLIGGEISSDHVPFEFCNSGSPTMSGFKLEIEDIE